MRSNFVAHEFALNWYKSSFRSIELLNQLYRMCFVDRKLDEGTQVALALSASMQPEAPSRRGRGNPAKSKLKFTRPPPALIERDPADSVKIVADRVAAIISRTSISSESLSSDLPVSKLNSSDEHTPEAKKKMWSLSEKLETEMLDSFYVSALQPPLSPMKEDADFRFRSLTQIPGFKLALDTSQRAVKVINLSFRFCVLLPGAFTMELPFIFHSFFGAATRKPVTVATEQKLEIHAPWMSIFGNVLSP